VVLQIATPVGTEFVKDCAGTYYLQDDTVNSYPLWMKEGPKDEFTARYLYFAEERYHVGGNVQRRKNFLNTRGYIQGPRILPSVNLSVPVMPHEVAGPWEWYAGAGFEYVPDPNVSVSAMI